MATNDHLRFFFWNSTWTYVSRLSFSLWFNTPTHPHLSYTQRNNVETTRQVDYLCYSNRWERDVSLKKNGAVENTRTSHAKRCLSHRCCLILTFTKDSSQRRLSWFKKKRLNKTIPNLHSKNLSLSLSLNILLTSMCSGKKRQ